MYDGMHVYARIFACMDMTLGSDLLTHATTIRLHVGYTCLDTTVQTIPAVAALTVKIAV